MAFLNVIVALALLVVLMFSPVILILSGFFGLTALHTVAEYAMIGAVVLVWMGGIVGNLALAAV